MNERKSCTCAFGVRFTDSPCNLRDVRLSISILHTHFKQSTTASIVKLFIALLWHLLSNYFVATYLRFFTFSLFYYHIFVLGALKRIHFTKLIVNCTVSKSIVVRVHQTVAISCAKKKHFLCSQKLKVKQQQHAV